MMLYYVTHDGAQFGVYYRQRAAAQAEVNHLRRAVIPSYESRYAVGETTAENLLRRYPACEALRELIDDAGVVVRK